MYIFKKCISFFALYEPSWFGLARIVLWTILFLFLANTYWPTSEPVINARHLNAAKASSVIPMMVDSTYPGWIREDKLEIESNKNTIAWVTGSSSHISFKQNEDSKIRIHDYLPIRVDKALKKMPGTDAQQYMYLVSGRRVIDSYALLQDAIDREMDLIIWVLNPFWDLNNTAIFLRGGAFYAGARSWWTTKDWPKQFSMVSPSAHLYGALGRHLPLLATPTSYRKLITTTSADIFDITAKKRKSTVKRPKYKQSLQFWNDHGVIENFDENNALDLPANLKWQTIAVSSTNIDENTLPVILLRNSLKMIEESNIKTIIYLAPVSPELLTYPKAAEGYNATLKFIESLERNNKNENLQFITQLPEKVLSSLIYRDFIHLKDDGILDEYLAKEIKQAISDPKH